MSEADHNPAAARAEFTRLFVRHQRVLFGYLVNQLGNTADAEEVLQETSVVLLTEWEKFTPGSNFVAWACRIALNQVHRFRRQQKRIGPQLDGDLLEQIASEGAERWQLAEQRRGALQTCLGKLSTSDREMIAAIYGESTTMAAAAEKLGRPVNTVYKGVQRIRKVLLDCIQRTLRAEEQP